MSAATAWWCSWTSSCRSVQHIWTTTASDWWIQSTADCCWGPVRHLKPALLNTTRHQTDSVDCHDSCFWLLPTYGYSNLSVTFKMLICFLPLLLIAKNHKIICEEPRCHLSCKEWTHLLRVLLAVECPLQTSPITQPPVRYIHTAVPHCSYMLGLHCTAWFPPPPKNVLPLGIPHHH